jgi:hypothetical protein
MEAVLLKCSDDLLSFFRGRGNEVLKITIVVDAV